MAIPQADLSPMEGTELQQIRTTVESLPQKEREILLTWFKQLMRPTYARSISKLATQSPTLLLVSAGALYSALFSRGLGEGGETPQ